MSLLSPRLQLKVAQKQILTPGLVQMVTILQLNRLELKEMVTQEIVQNPVLEESTNEPGEEITPEELLPLLEAEQIHDPADRQLLEAAVLSDANSVDDGRMAVPLMATCSPMPRNPPPPRSWQRTIRSRSTIRWPSRPPPPTPSTRSILAASSTNTWIPVTRAPRRNRSKSLPSRPFCLPPSPSAIICARS